MFNSISWQEYFSAIALLVIGYYAVTTLVFYRNEISNIFNQRASKKITADNSTNQGDAKDTNSLIGIIKYESPAQKDVPREELSEAEEMSFAPLTEADEPINGMLNNAINRLVATLLTEIESLLTVITNDDKKEIATLFQALLHNYPQLVATDFQDEISRHIYDALRDRSDFQIELKEVKAWWPAGKQDSEDNQ